MYYFDLLAHYGVWIVFIIVSTIVVINFFKELHRLRYRLSDFFVSVILIILVFFIWKKVPIPEHPDVAILRKAEEQKMLQEQTDKRNKAKEQLKSEMLKLAKEKIPELYKAIDETKQMTVKINENKTKLTEVLVKLERKPEEDEDIKNYNNLLEILKTNSKEYDKQLKEAYLQYQKFLISSDPEYNKIIEKYNTAAKQSLEESVKKFKEMRNELSEERTKENLDK